MNQAVIPVATGGTRASPWRTSITAVVFSYTITWTLLAFGLELIGERWWPLAVLLYIPQQVFLLPFLILIPALLLVEAPKACWGALLWCLIIFLWHTPFYPGITSSPRPGRMKLISNNYGQNHGLRLDPFIRNEDPDIVVLEDAGGRGPEFQRSFPDRTVRALGQFVLVSKAPVKSVSLLNWPRWKGTPIASVFVVTWRGRDVAIYATHLPTPRSDFSKLTGLGLLREIAGRNRRRSDNMSFSEAMTARVQLARDFASVLAQEQRPYIVAGDFNMPSGGYVRRVIAGQVTDAFAQAGRGFGFTFPCDTHNPITLGGPWLRLDCILAGPGWKIDDCRVEPDRRSQHRAVVASLGQ